MLSFLTGDEASMEAFLSVSEASPYQPPLRDYAHSLLEQRCTRPEWCVIGVAADVPVARAAFWAMPDEEVPSDLVLIDADWSQPQLADGHALLARMHELAGALGARKLQHHVDSPPGPPQYQENESERISLVTEVGYELLRDGLRWLWTSPAVTEPSPIGSLAFRGLAEVGQEAFVEAFSATYEGTRDSMLGKAIRERGLLDAAQSDFREYQELEHRPEWWELAFTEDGALAGVIMGARIPGSAVIGHVGVVPEQRGRGFAAQLVRRGTAQLVADGATEIRGDCDRDNVAMVKAFRRAGYEQIARRRTYQRSLPA
jgi:ribosomal protein S18 acetylase RimI-like enzyme